jgi:putative nucleotidyltransferase with HDIG domain
MPAQLEDLLEKWVASPPTVYTELQKAINNPDATFLDYENIIKVDPSLTARLLKVVNSAFFGLTAKVETITHALTIIGIVQLTDMALATEMMNKFKGIPKDLLDVESFWKHCIATGLASRLIARYKNEENSEQYYVAGMLHDLGTLVYVNDVPEEARQVLAICQKGGASLASVENKFFGFTHADVGAALMAKWNLPEKYQEAVRHHHNPSRAKKFPLFVGIIHLGDIIAHQLEIGASGESGVPPIDKNFVKKLGFTEDQIDAIKEQVESEMEEVGEAYFN